MTNPVQIPDAAVQEAEAVIERCGEEFTAAALIGYLAGYLRENGKAVLTTSDSSLGKQILEFKLAADNLRALSAEPAQGAKIGLGWVVRERRAPNGELLDCFVEAPKNNGMAYALEVLGDDYTDYGDIDAKLEHCKMIAAWANAEPVQGKQWRDMKDAPRDGTKIDVWMMPHGYRETDVFWSDIEEAWCREGEHPDEPTPLSVVPYPAFWMPSPAAPTPEAEA